MPRIDQNNAQYSRKEADKRLRAILKGATEGPPTPLKAIPKRNGEARKTSASKSRPR